MQDHRHTLHSGPTVIHLADVTFHQFEPWMTFEVGHVGALAGSEIVHAAHRMSCSDKGIAEMTSYEAGATRDKDGTGIASGHGSREGAVCHQR